MKANNIPSPFITTSSGMRVTYGDENPFRAFDRYLSSTRWASGISTGWLKIYIGTAQVVTLYSLTSRSDGYLTEMPKNWTLEGSNDNSSWSTLDTQTNITWASNSLMKYFTVSSAGSYSYYRINVSANGGSSYVSISNFGLYTSGAGSASDISDTVAYFTMADVTDEWSALTTTFTPAFSGTIDADILIYPASVFMKVWVDDFLVT
jgi:hypothetical protein